MIGSTNFTAQAYGFAAGMDRHISPDLVAGFALAGGGTHWDLAQAMGGGRSDAFQVGAYATKYFGPAYVAADIAFANHWTTTSRTAFAGDQLTANFNAQSYGGRIEAGYRNGLPATWSATPYGALQVQNFHTPQYSETDLIGGGFGLTYNAMSAYDTRGELGARFDEPTTLAAHPARALGLGARLGQRTCAAGGVRDAARSEFHRQRRGDTEEFRVDHRRCRAASDTSVVVARQVRRRVRQELADLRRHRHGALRVVTRPSCLI